MYGGGQYDFMNNFESKGEYCFPCAIIQKNDEKASYTYLELEKYLEDNSYREKLSFVSVGEDAKKDLDLLTKSIEDLKNDIKGEDSDYSK